MNAKVGPHLLDVLGKYNNQMEPGLKGKVNFLPQILSLMDSWGDFSAFKNYICIFDFI